MIRWVVGAMLLTGASAHAETTIQFNNFADVSNLSFSGDATGPVTVNTTPTLRIVPAKPYQSGAVVLSAPITLGPQGQFTTSFQFQVVGTNSAEWSDGMTFVLAASPEGLGGSGANGGYLGYQGVGNSMAVEYDTYYNVGSDALPNEVAVTTDGNTSTSDNPAGSAGEPYGVSMCGGIDGPSGAGCLNDERVWSTNISYDGQAMTVTVQDGASPPVTVISNYKIDLLKALGTRTVYAGFTAATGGGFANFLVYDWMLRY